jgi:integrase/recombinase XerD
MMNIGDVSFDEAGAIVTVSGKTGGRTVRLISSAPILGKYLESHPHREDPAFPLWISNATNYRGRWLKWLALSKILKQAAKRAGIKKRVHNHMLRHGSATVNAKYLKDSELKAMYGWTMSSRMASVYVHLQSSDLDDKLQSIYGGRLAEQKPPEFTQVICSRCKEKNSPSFIDEVDSKPTELT